MISEQEVIMRVQGLSLVHIQKWVNYGWISPSHGPKGFHFSDIDIARLQLIHELRNDLAVNTEAIPIVLSLIDQVHGLRHKLRSLARAVEAQHTDIQLSILQALKKNSDDT